MAHNCNYWRTRAKVVKVIFAQKHGGLLRGNLDSLLSFVNPLNFHVLCDRNYGLFVQHLTHLNGNTLHEERFDHLSLRRGEELCEVFNSHAVSGNFKNLHSYSLVLFCLGSALRAFRSFAPSALFNLICTARTTHLRSSTSTFTAVGESKICAAATSPGACAARRLSIIPKSTSTARTSSTIPASGKITTPTATSTGEIAASAPAAAAVSPASSAASTTASTTTTSPRAPFAHKVPVLIAH
mmetsp:Transcript_6920/g.25201  ORF Transcript_6920/g.25201 Transcript_6920/m.25201 type:complete len:241 (+) Transcript_6920:2453-3175(+)